MKVITIIQLTRNSQIIFSRSLVNQTLFSRDNVMKRSPETGIIVPILAEPGELEYGKQNLMFRRSREMILLSQENK